MEPKNFSSVSNSLESDSGASNQADRNVVIKKSTFSCLRVFVILIAIVVVLIFAFYLYGKVAKGTFTYDLNGQKILSIKYPKAYYTRVDSDNPDQQGFRLLSSASIDYSDIMIFTVHKKNKNEMYSTPEKYLSSNSMGSCNYQQYGNNKLCFATNFNPGLAVLSSNDFLIEILITDLTQKGTVNYILDSLSVY